MSNQNSALVWEPITASGTTDASQSPVAAAKRAKVKTGWIYLFQYIAGGTPNAVFVPDDHL